MNPWHDVELGDQAPEIFNCIIEIPIGSKVKYELDKKTGLLRVDRVLFSADHYPANYGFLPQTYCDDKDPLDVLVLGQVEVAPLCIMRAKIIGVHYDDPESRDYRDISELPEYRLKAVKRFFEDYKALENKQVKVERFMGRYDALNIIEESVKLYNDLKPQLIGT